MGTRFSGNGCLDSVKFELKPSECDHTVLEEVIKMVCTAVIHKEDEWYVAQCPETGTTSQGETVEQAVENLKEATTLYLEEFPQELTFRPLVTTFEVPAYA